MVKPVKADARHAGTNGFRMSDFSLSRLLGGITPENFLAEYWQKKPLLVRQALPGFGDWLDRRSLSELACSDDAESRLVRFQRGQCLLEHGPFEPEALQKLPKRNWSLLVSGVNHLLPEADQLLHRFNFLPHARLDDLMVSFAPPGAGVGPHFDSYDVFLIQGRGRRRWEISGQTDLTTVDDAPLRILRDFQAEQTWELEPGDMLYLPPRFAHNGVALTDCMTWSVGFRAPGTREIVGQFFNYLQDQLGLGDDTGERYADPDLRRPAHPAEIPAELLQWTERAIREIRWDKALITDFLGRYLSEPKAHVFFDPPCKPLAALAFGKSAARRGLVLDARSQLLFSGKVFFMNGERLETTARLVTPLRALADDRKLPPCTLDPDLLGLLHTWYQAGYLHLGEEH
jgi:50S ribosomal protein L16 3-hydroxylase